MKKSLTVMSALLLLTSAGAGITLNQVTAPATSAQAATLNAAKLANGKYSIAFSMYQTGTTTISEASNYLSNTAAVSVNNKKATVTITGTKNGNMFIKALTLGGKTATVKQVATGNTYTFSNVDLTKDQTIGFSLAVPVNGQTVTMQESATLKFNTASLKATSKAQKKVALTTKQVKAQAKKLSGTTTKGAKVTVKHNKTTLGKVTTKKKAYTVKLKKAVKKSWKLTVTANKAGYKTVTKTVIVK
ncbi:NEAT domain-containing protein [Levilactobacillus cerevisiae]|uniref:NEAT domain-containing protein n=1 Tax=Levilactobacillus cerevisiae TaxID=1704076 RepID=UPI000F7A64E6|nr:NEAT domain-containing protein [Levilactobacillus cerevisiae]